MRATAKRMWLGVGAAAMFAAVAACGQSTTTPTNTNTGGSNAVSDALTNPDVGMFSVPAADTSLGGGVGPWAFTPGNGQFGGPLGKDNGLTVTRTVTYRDADGNIQAAFDPNTTASITTDTTATGTRSTRGGGSVTVNRTGEMVVTGLAGANTTRTLNGQEQGTVVATSTAADGTAITLNSTESDQTVNLVVPVVDRGPNNPQVFPLSGSRTHSDTTTTTRGSQTTTNTLVRTETYNGTSTAQVTITRNGVTTQCTVDLTTKANGCGM